MALRSRNPFDPPAIWPNYLDSQADVDDLTEGVRMLRRIVHATAMDAFRGREIFPGPKTRSDEAIHAFLRGAVETSYHPVGTCKMGSDPMAVVNHRLEMHDVVGLRVVDASIMPAIVSGNTNAPTLMIAEKAADMIKAARV